MDTPQPTSPTPITPQAMASSTSLPQIEAVNVSNSPKRSNNKLFVVIALVVVVIAVVAGIVIILNNRNSNTNINNDNLPSDITSNQQDNTAPILPQPVSSPAALDRLAVQLPLVGQQMDGTPVKLMGKMKDFFEGNMKVKLVSDSGTKIYEGSVMAKTDNYGKLADFDSTIDYGTIPASLSGKTGKWEFIEVSMKDGSETVLYSVPIIFK